MTSSCSMNSSWITSTEGSMREEETIIRQYIIKMNCNDFQDLFREYSAWTVLSSQRIMITFFLCDHTVNHKPLLEYFIGSTISLYSWYSWKSAHSTFLPGRKHLSLSWCDCEMTYSKFTPFQTSGHLYIYLCIYTCSVYLYLNFLLTLQNACHSLREIP